MLKKFADINYPCTLTRRVVYRGELGTAEVMVAVDDTVLVESFDCTGFLTDTKLASAYNYYVGVGNGSGKNTETVGDVCVFATIGFGNDVGVVSIKFGEWGADIQQS